MACERHPAAGEFGLYCPACLLEEALAAPAPFAGGGSADPTADEDIDFEQLTIQLPLGRSEAASVFLVTQATVPGRLYRLKAWRSPAASGFVDRVRRLKVQLAGWQEPAVDAPLAALVDATGCPSIVGPFRRGMPILDVLHSGNLDARAAAAHIDSLAQVVVRAHARGLPHGSIVPGNVMVHAGTAYLLDFGLTGLLRPSTSQADLMASDLAGLAALERALAP